MSYPHLGTDCGSFHQLVRDFGTPNRPKIVVLCGSTRFYDEFQKANYELTMAGEIVLSVGFYPHAAAEHGHGEGVGHDSAEKVELDELNKRKIDLADYVLVLNVGGYIGSSTRSEIEYATKHRKPVRYLVPVDGADDAPVQVRRTRAEVRASYPPLIVSVFDKVNAESHLIGLAAVRNVMVACVRVIDLDEFDDCDAIEPQLLHPDDREWRVKVAAAAGYGKPDGIFAPKIVGLVVEAWIELLADERAAWNAAAEVSANA